MKKATKKTYKTLVPMNLAYLARFDKTLHQITFLGMATIPRFVPGRFTTDNPSIQNHLERHSDFNVKIALEKEIVVFQKPEKKKVETVEETEEVVATEVVEEPIKVETEYIDEVTGRTYANAGLLKRAINARIKAAKNN